MATGGAQRLTPVRLQRDEPLFYPTIKEQAYIEPHMNFGKRKQCRVFAENGFSGQHLNKLLSLVWDPTYIT
jgi:hypothetical protein